MKVYINKYVTDPVTENETISSERQIVNAEVIEENEKTVWVKLPDGHIIKRKKSRDIVQ